MLKTGGGLVWVDVLLIFWTGGSNVIGLFKVMSAELILSIYCINCNYCNVNLPYVCADEQNNENFC